MVDRLFNDKERELLQRNKNVLRVSDMTITYNPEFKVEAVYANLRYHKPPNLIFIDAGFDLDLIGRENPKRCLQRWRTIYKQRGEEGLRNDQRGKHSTGRPLERELTLEEKLRRAEARVKYLEEENELLKKFDATERGVVGKPSEKFRLIQSILASRAGVFTVSNLCEMAGVSRSGYYRWLSSEAKRNEQEKRDYEQHLLIQDIFLKKNRHAGWRTIRMNLEHQAIVMNHKKIIRLMNKYGLITQIRRKNPYKHMAKATQEHRTLPNVLDRKFTQGLPYRVFGTDVTYLRDGSGQRSYLSVLRDMATGEIVAHHFSMSLGMGLSVDLIQQAVRDLGEETFMGAIIHSDQGFHYTHPTYVQQLSRLSATQSMSRKGNCIDNAPTESFFGHMKDDLDLGACHSAEQVRARVNE